MSCASSIPERPLHAGYPIENQMPNTGTRKNEPMRPQIYNRTTPREKGGLGADDRRGFGITALLPEPAPQPVHADGGEKKDDRIDGMAVTQRGVRHVIKQRKNHRNSD